MLRNQVSIKPHFELSTTSSMRHKISISPAIINSQVTRRLSNILPEIEQNVICEKDIIDKRREVLKLKRRISSEEEGEIEEIHLCEFKSFDLEPRSHSCSSLFSIPHPICSLHTLLRPSISMACRSFGPFQLAYTARVYNYNQNSLECSLQTMRRANVSRIFEFRTVVKHKAKRSLPFLSSLLIDWNGAKCSYQLIFLFFPLSWKL